MEIVSNTTDFCFEEETAVAIGKFDGVHTGHRRLLEEILNARGERRRSCVFTFDPSPAVLFGGDIKELTTREEKREIFAFLGVDILVEFPLNRETAAILPQVFVEEVLCEKLQASFVAAGTDVTFGAGGAGNAALLRAMAKKRGLEVRIIEKLIMDGQEVSSTLVREAVAAGDLVRAEQLLGAPYMVKGVVRHGNRIGHSLGMPTINLLPPENKILPPSGVYYSGVWIDGVYYRGISNVGYRPTVEESKKALGVETYLYDFDREVYGREAAVELYEFRRPEQRFESLEELKDQIKRDVEAGAGYGRKW